LTFSTDTSCSGITNSSSRTLTATGISLRYGQGSLATGARITGIWLLNTFLISTDQSILAIWIYHTFWSTTCNGVRLGDQSRKTLTDWISISVWCTGCTRSTGGRITGIWLFYTLLIATYQSITTVRINYTLWSTSCDCVRLRDQSWKTSTDRISISVGSTSSSRTTGRWVARISQTASDLWSRVRHQSLGTLACRPALVRDAHRPISTRVGVTWVPWWGWWWRRLIFWLWRWGWSRI